ncbi:MAG: hypothetical protein LYZ69_04930 [Nitrososphaerales archaeon]|nr:hypothetical protein [Nitrososphaerales archaeon]
MSLASESLRQSQPPGKYEGPIVPVVLSILGIVVWLVFILFYALYWSSGFSLFQNVIVAIVSLAIAGLLIGLMWMPWYRVTGERR